MSRAGTEFFDLLVAGSVLALAVLVSAALLRVVVPAAANAAHRDRYLDGLRGVAAVGVMASHFGGNMAYALAPAQQTALFHNCGTAGVQVFFALTGYLFTRKAVAARGHLALPGFFANRVRRIVPMYSAAVVLSIALVCLITWREPVAWGRLARQTVALYAYGFVLDGSPQIKSVPYVDVIGTIWTLPFEWGFYFTVPFLAVLATSWRMLAAAGVVAGVYFAVLMTDGRGDVFSVFFLPGVLMGLLPAAPIARGRTTLAAIAGLLALAAILGGEQDFTPARLLLMGLVFAGVVLARPALLSYRPVAFLGDISYSVYLLHFPVLFVIKAMLTLGGPGPLHVAAILLAGSGAVIVLSAVTYRYIEQPFLPARGTAAFAIAAV